MPAQSAIRRGVEFPLCEFGGGEFPVAGAEGAAGIEVEEEWAGSGIRGNKNPVLEKERTSTGELREKFLLLNFADLGVAEGHDVAVVLKADVALGGLAEVFELFEFGSGDALVPVVRTFDVFDILGAVHPLHALLGSDENAEGIPLTGGLGGIHSLGGLVKLVKPSGFLRIVTFDVVLDLNFRAGLPRSLFGFLNMEHESGISAGRNFVIDAEFEGLVLFLRDDVAAAFFGEGEGAVFDDPGVFDAFLFVVTEMFHCFAVK